MGLQCVVVEELVTGLDMFEIHQRLAAAPPAMLLESQMDFDGRGRYSFLGVHPVSVLRGDAASYVWNDGHYQGSVFDKLRELLDARRCAPHAHLPMTAGWLGFVSYDAGLRLEAVASSARPSSDLPEACFVFYDNLIIRDHKEGKTYVTACGLLRSAAAGIALIKDRLIAPRAVPEGIPSPNKADDGAKCCQSNFTREKYLAAIEKTRQHIRDGDVYVMNMTRQIAASTTKSAPEIYAALRSFNPAPFAALLQFNDFEVISSSPERFLKVAAGMVETRPIKGTTPRGASPDQDEANRLRLLESAKDRAELLMIVDLERNDLNKVCHPQSVRVTEHCALESYSTLFHLVSTVRGELREPYGALDCLLACFPGGSITGAPKRSAMTIIDSLEGVRRGLYTGCIGYFACDGNADFNIVIRTLVKRGGEVCFGVGGGITWESDAAAEYQETQDKALALIRAACPEEWEVKP